MTRCALSRVCGANLGACVKFHGLVNDLNVSTARLMLRLAVKNTGAEVDRATHK